MNDYAQRPADVEQLLERALAPVEPPEDLAMRLQRTLIGLQELAADELEGWELGAMRDPRNWVRPVAAAAVGTAAGAALVVLRVRARQRARRSSARDVGDLIERTARDVSGEVARVLPGRGRRR